MPKKEVTLGLEILADISHHCNIIVIVSGTTNRILIEHFSEQFFYSKSYS